MNTKHFDYLIEAAQTLNFNKAAENLYISQPALSYQIKTIEEEIGFLIFERNGKSVRLTPAGRQFIEQIQHIRQQLQTYIEQGQNFSQQFHDTIHIGYPLRSTLLFLPEIIQQFHQTYPDVLLTPSIDRVGLIEQFNAGHLDLLFATKDSLPSLPNTIPHSLYTSSIYLLVANDDPLASLSQASPADLSGRTLLINGGSGPLLRKVQQETLKQNPMIQTLNSPTHDFTLVTIASQKAVCLSPGFLNDFSNEFTWIPFENTPLFDCLLLTHKSDNRLSLECFIQTAQHIYAKKQKSYPL